jgi:putative transposon-encoded protein
MKIILIAAGIALACSLGSCHKRLIPTQTAETKDSVNVQHEIEYKDTTIYVPGTTVHIVDSIPCPEVTMHREVKNNGTTATVDINKGKMNVDCKTDSLQVIIQMLRRELIRQVNFHNTKEVVQVPVDVPKPYIPKWVWWSLVANAGFGIWTFRTPILSLIKRFI